VLAFHPGELAGDLGQRRLPEIGKLPASGDVRADKDGLRGHQKVEERLAAGGDVDEVLRDRERQGKRLGPGLAEVLVMRLLLRLNGLNPGDDHGRQSLAAIVLSGTGDGRAGEGDRKRLRRREDAQDRADRFRTGGKRSQRRRLRDDQAGSRHTHHL